MPRTNSSDCGTQMVLGQRILRRWRCRITFRFLIIKRGCSSIFCIYSLGIKNLVSFVNKKHTRHGYLLFRWWRFGVRMYACASAEQDISFAEIHPTSDASTQPQQMRRRIVKESFQTWDCMAIGKPQTYLLYVMSWSKNLLLAATHLDDDD